MLNPVAYKRAATSYFLFLLADISFPLRNERRDGQGDDFWLVNHYHLNFLSVSIRRSVASGVSPFSISYPQPIQPPFQEPVRSPTSSSNAMSKIGRASCRERV